MPQQQQQQQQREGFFSLIPARNVFFLVSNLADIVALTVKPVIRYGGGSRSVGKPGLYTLLGMIAYAGTMESPELLFYVKAWVIFVLYRRVRCDPRQHTGFQGWPVLTDWIIKNDKFAFAAEPFLVYLAGMYLEPICEPMARLLMWASFALAFEFFVNTSLARRRKEAAHNAVVEMEITQREMHEVIAR
jgi:hypothetical protein